MNILLTNDDSHRSPLLRYLINTLKRYGDVHLVVPHHEQSWTGKSMTRFAPLHVHEVEIWGHRGYAVTGTPADCSHLGIYNLLPKKPDIVVSGINAGLNSGIGFVLSSGTVGACLEANIAGIPGIAISQAFDPSTRETYIADYTISEQTMQIFEERYDRLLEPLLTNLMAGAVKQSLPPVTWNVNIPFKEASDCRMKICRLSASFYRNAMVEDRAMEQEGERVFRHDLFQVVLDEDAQSDSKLIAAGYGTVSIINPFLLSGRLNVEEPNISSLLGLLGGSAFL